MKSRHHWLLCVLSSPKLDGLTAKHPAMCTGTICTGREPIQPPGPVRARNSHDVVRTGFDSRLPIADYAPSP